MKRLTFILLLILLTTSQFGCVRVIIPPPTVNMGMRVTIDAIKVSSWGEYPDIYFNLSLGGSEFVRLPAVTGKAWTDWPVDNQWYQPPEQNVALWDIADSPIDYKLIMYMYDYDPYDPEDDTMVSAQVTVNYGYGKKTYSFANDKVAFRCTVEPVKLGSYTSINMSIASTAPKLLGISSETTDAPRNDIIVTSGSDNR